MKYLIFTRDKNRPKEFELEAILSKNKKNEEKQFLEFTAKGTQKNQLFLSEIRTRKVKENVSNIDDLINVIDWFQNALTVIYPNSKNVGKKFELLEDTDLNKVFTEMLGYFDTGIDGIEFKEVDIEKIDIPSEILKDIENDLLGDKSEKTNAFISNVLLSYQLFSILWLLNFWVHFAHCGYVCGCLMMRSGDDDKLNTRGWHR